jgi:hypothetical protein
VGLLALRLAAFARLNSARVSLPPIESERQIQLFDGTIDGLYRAHAMTAEIVVSVFQIAPRRSQRLHCSPDIGVSLALRSKHNIAAGQAQTDDRRQGSHGRRTP